nr:BBE domain-containing protein [Glycomyces salinus]
MVRRLLDRPASAFHGRLLRQLHRRPGGPERVKSTYRGHFDRLAEIKRTYDPDNFFHANQNIPPAAA